MRAFAALLVLALLLTACGGAADSGSSGEAAGSEEASSESAAADGERSEIRLTTMPAPSGFPVWLAEELGFYEDNGLEVTNIEYVPSGAPMLESGLAGEWDAGYIGAPPAIVGGARWGMITAGVEAEESGIHAIYVRPGEVPEGEEAQALEGGQALAVTGSTGHQVLRDCMDSFGVSLDDMDLISLEMPSIVSSFERGEGLVAQVWDPFLVRMDEEHERLCSGDEVGSEIYVVFQVHPDFVERDRDAAVAYLEAVYRANEMMEEEPETVMPLIRQYLNDQGVEIDDASLELAVSGRDWLSLEEAAEQMASGQTEEGLRATAEFLTSVGNLDEVPDFGFVDPSLIQDAVELRESRG